MKNILVTGANGQLGRCLKDLSVSQPNYNFYFADRTELDLGNPSSIQEFFESHDVDYCINAGAYTNVEKAESESELAFRINGEAVQQLASACVTKKAILIHVSTDYVFDGTKKTPYVETDATHPLNVYGASKLQGEKAIESTMENYFIIRTSWLYSQYGHNFLKSILKFSEQKKELTITTEQIGTPTNANDLAAAIIHIIVSESKAFGIYHFSNDGEATWFDFAKEILVQTQRIEAVNLAETDYYPTFAQRPKYSVLDKQKFTNNFNHTIIPWKEALSNVISKLPKL